MKLSRIALFLLLCVCCAGVACAKPVMDRSEEAKLLLLDSRDIPGLKVSFVRPTQWFINDGQNGEPVSYVGSISQRTWRRKGQIINRVEAAMFPTQEDAIRAAELRLKELKSLNDLQDLSFKGGQLPDQGKGDRVWVVWDPPETGQPPQHGKNISRISGFAAVIFVKKNICVQVSTEDTKKSVSVADLEDVARKIAVKTKKISDRPAGNKQP